MRDLRKKTEPEQRGPTASRDSSEVESLLDQYRPRYKRLLDDIQADVDEFLATGEVTRARELARQTGQHLNHNEWPLFFTGDLDASFVLIHLNPKHADNTAPRALNPSERFPSWEEYFYFHRHFGARTYGPKGIRRPPISRFDQKQIRFLQPFGTIDFVEQRTPEDRWTNLERVVDRKLQMELVPYGSANFSTTAFRSELLEGDFERLLSVLSAAPRDYIFFCGQVFEPLLRRRIVEEHQFHLLKKDGSREVNRSRFANVRIPYNDGFIAAGLAHSWPRQGIPITSYAEECRKRYHLS